MSDDQNPQNEGMDEVELDTSNLIPNVDAAADAFAQATQQAAATAKAPQDCLLYTSPSPRD